MEIISLRNLSINHALRDRGMMRGDLAPSVYSLTLTHRALMSLYNNFENFIKTVS